MEKKVDGERPKVAEARDQTPELAALDEVVVVIQGEGGNNIKCC